MLKVKNVSKTYPKTKLNVISGMSFVVNPSEIVMITGPSGCGKTTLLNIISGSMTGYDGNINGSFKKIGYVFQEDRLLEWKTVFQNIRLVAPKEDENRAMRIIAAVGLKGFESYYPKDLSGGMRQRCSIARALYYGADMLLLDEPFKSLDSKLRRELLELVNKIRNQEKTSVLFVTHDLEEALKIGDRILILTKRPARIAKEIKISQRFEQRNLDSLHFYTLRKKILKHLEA